MGRILRGSMLDEKREKPQCVKEVEARKLAAEAAMTAEEREDRWHTEDEEAFLRTLGTHLPGSRQTPRAEWLTRYLEAMPLRHDWGTMDRNKVAESAVQQWGHAVKQAVRARAA